MEIEKYTAPNGAFIDHSPPFQSTSNILKASDHIHCDMVQITSINHQCSLK